MPNTQTKPVANNDLQALQKALDALEVSATNFAVMAINDSAARMQYVRDIRAIAPEFMDAVKSGRMSAAEAAEAAVELRNKIMDLTRLRTSPIARAYASSIKKQGLTFATLLEKNATKLFNKPLATLSTPQQTAVFSEVIQGAGHANQGVVDFAKKVGKIGRRLFLVSLGFAVYDIYQAENKPREFARQGTLAVAGAAGGWAIGAGAVATGVCAATAPICVGAAVLVGGLLFAFGADFAFGTFYPRPAGH